VNHHIILDLVFREAVEKWLKYLREETAYYGLQVQHLGAEIKIRVEVIKGSKNQIKKTITVGVIGLPNVGKSIFINILKRAHVVNVCAIPRLTRSMQEVQLDKNIKLLDCPGVVMLKSLENDASIALRNCKRIEKLDNLISPGYNLYMQTHRSCIILETMNALLAEHIMSV
ncbi:hypothetical protein S83_020212, partial [Arachis hypogaea]